MAILKAPTEKTALAFRFPLTIRTAVTFAHTNGGDPAIGVSRSNRRVRQLVLSSVNVYDAE